MAFNQKNNLPVAKYTFANIQLEIVDETKYSGVVLQSNLKFDGHIESNTTGVKQQLGMIKHVLRDAPEKANLLAYTSLCRLHVEYASTVLGSIHPLIDSMGSIHPLNFCIKN